MNELCSGAEFPFFFKYFAFVSFTAVTVFQFSVVMRKFFFLIETLRYTIYTVNAQVVLSI